MTAPCTFAFYVLAGDADHDRTVGPGDFNILASNFGKTGQAWSTGDFDYDGVVGPGDFNILASQFGKTLAPPAATLSAPVVHAPVISAKRNMSKRGRSGTPAAEVLTTEISLSSGRTVRRKITP
jgi:hypothetical protein